LELGLEAEADRGAGHRDAELEGALSLSARADRKDQEEK
jgi:hypothetical protein